MVDLQRERAVSGHHKWADVRAAYLADMTPEQRALYDQAKRDRRAEIVKDLRAELAKYAAEHPEHRAGADDGEESR